MGFSIGKFGKGLKKLSSSSIVTTIIVAVVGVIVTELMEVLVKDFVAEVSKDDTNI
jgi:hypothetical protein